MAVSGRAPPRRSYACNHVLTFEVVTADGHARHVDAQTERDLFYALRGVQTICIDAVALEPSEADHLQARPPSVTKPIPRRVRADASGNGHPAARRPRSPRRRHRM